MIQIRIDFNEETCEVVAVRANATMPKLMVPAILYETIAFLREKEKNSTAANGIVPAVLVPNGQR